MTWPFVLVAALTVGSAVSALAWRNLVHSALSLVVTFAGLAALYLQLNAEFIGFVQVLVYVGAVAILIVFAILLTRGTEPAGPVPFTTAAPWAISIAVASFVILAGAVTQSERLARGPNGGAEVAQPTPLTPEVVTNATTATTVTPSSAAEPGVSVKALGFRLMEE